jgi:hypothetical protein
MHAVLVQVLGLDGAKGTEADRERQRRNGDAPLAEPREGRLR